MSTNECWEKSLAAGQRVELYVLSRIMKKYPRAYQLEGNNPKWDIFIPEIGIGIEVKSDANSMRTGNYVVEVSSGTNPSGLTTTKCDYWVIFDGECLVWISPLNLMRCIIYNGIPLRRFRAGGDNNVKGAYLLQKELLKRWADSIDVNLTDIPNEIKSKKDEDNTRD